MVPMRAVLGVLMATLCTAYRPKVRIAYELTYTPEKLAMYRGYFEKFTGYDIEWIEISDSSKAITALENGDVDLATVNSIDFARACTRQADLRLIFINHMSSESEGLLVGERYHLYKRQAGQPSGTMHAPRDLLGKRVGAAWGTVHHYLTSRLMDELGIEVMSDKRYQYQPNGTKCLAQYQPCYFEPRPNSVEMPQMNEIEVEESFMNGSIHAAYVGFPQYVRMQELTPGASRNNGYKMLSSRMLERWGLMSFSGLVVRHSWAVEDPESSLMLPNITHAAFLQNYVLEVAKAIYYYQNNTKEFYMAHTGDRGVNYKLASVINGQWDVVASHLDKYRYLTLTEQAGCNYLGCGAGSQVAWALRDQALFLETLKEGYDKTNMTARNEHYSHSRQRSQEDGLDHALDSAEAYAGFIDPTYITNNLAFGFTGEYELQLNDVAVPLSLGYGDQYVDVA